MGHKPNQAVILAGGSGTRLRPFTDTQPKPMYPFHGKPFMEYLVAQLRDQGFKKILMLLGYLPDVIMDHFGDGSKFGIEIFYSVTEVENNTGTRLREAKSQIDQTFLLMYCDNYWPMNFDRFWSNFVAASVPAQVLVYNNTDSYTRSNLIVDDQGFVAVYDKSRKTEGLNGVDIGFLILKKWVLDLLPEDGNPSFEAEVFPQLVAKRNLAAIVTGHRYYSVGSYERLHLTNSFLLSQKAILIDRDGTLNVKMPKAKYVTSTDKWVWLPGAREALAISTRAGYMNIIITNQPGIARKAMTEADLEDIHSKMKSEVEVYGGKIDAIYYCPHGWDEGCSCRKPAPGMIFQAQRDFDLNLSQVFYVGDDDRDGEASKSAETQWIKVDNNYTVLDAVRDIISKTDAH